MKNEPLGMPKGTVRAIITLLVVVFALVYSGFILYIKAMRDLDIVLPTFVLPLLGTTIGYYFGLRTTDVASTDVVITKGKSPEPIKYVPKEANEPPEVAAG